MLSRSNLFRGTTILCHFRKRWKLTDVFRAFPNYQNRAHFSELAGAHAVLGSHGNNKTNNVHPVNIKAQLLGFSGDPLSYQIKVDQLQRALDEWRQCPLTDEPTTASIMDQPQTLAMIQVASAYSELGMFPESLNILKQILKLHLDSNDNITEASNSLPQHLPMANLLHTIGATYIHLKDWTEAQKWLAASLEMKTCILDPHGKFTFHHEMGKTLNALAVLHLQDTAILIAGDENSIQEDPTIIQDQIPQSKALHLLQQAEMHYRYHGMDHSTSQHDKSPTTLLHPELASVLENIAIVYRNHDQYLKALDKYEQVLQIRMSWISSHVLATEGDYLIALTCLDLGDMLYALDRLDEAAERYEEALRLHSLTVMNHNKTNQGEGEDATEKLSNKEPTTVQAMESVLLFNLGKIHAQQGRFDIAMEHYQKALAIQKILAGDSHPQVAMVLNAIGALLATKGGGGGELETALSYFREAHFIYKNYSEEFSQGHEMVDQTRRNIERVQKYLQGSHRVQ